MILQKTQPARRHQPTTSYSGARPRIPVAAMHVDRPQAVDDALGEHEAAAQRTGELARREGLVAQRRGQEGERVGGRAQLDAVEHLHEAPLPRVALAASQHDRLGRADVVLPAQEHLDGEVGMREQRRERDELVEHRDGARHAR